MKNRKNPNQSGCGLSGKIWAKLGLQCKKSKEVINRFFFHILDEQYILKQELALMKNWPMFNQYQLRLNQYLTNINQYLMVQ